MSKIFLSYLMFVAAGRVFDTAVDSSCSIFHLKKEISLKESSQNQISPIADTCSMLWHYVQRCSKIAALYHFKK